MEKLRTYVEGLDEILHGGIPQYSVAVITGGPGTGKTVLTLQILFSNARRGAKCIYFTTLSEPATKLIRHTQLFEFFDEGVMGERFRFADVGTALRNEGPQKVLEQIAETVEAQEPDIVAIDSFKAIHDLARDPESARVFVYDLAVHLSTWSVTTFLVGEYTLDDLGTSPEFAVADAIIHMTYEREEMRSIRQLEVLKLRGSGFNGGRHYSEIDSSGMRVYPRVGTIEEDERIETERRVPSGVLGLDQMLHGGLPAGSATLIEGGSGIGKTSLGLHFMSQGSTQGEKGVIFAFEERPAQLRAVAEGLGIDMGPESGISIHYTSPVELLGPKWLATAREMVQRSGARRVMIDSLSAMMLSMPNERIFKELIYTAVKMFRSMGVTLIMTVEVPALLSSSVLTGYGISSIVDNIIVMRYVELESQLKRAIAVLKMRGTSHEGELREFRITGQGMAIGEPFKHYLGVLSGLPEPVKQR